MIYRYDVYVPQQLDTARATVKGDKLSRSNHPQHSATGESATTARARRDEEDHL